MSGSDEKQSCGCSGGNGGSGGNDQQDDIDGPVERSSQGERSRERRGKGVSLFRFSSAKKRPVLLQRRRRKKGILVNSKLSGRCGVGDGGAGVVGCCLCIKQPMTLDSSAESPTSDPNSKEFTYDMMRAFIEKNDFYARECNPHLDEK